MIRIFSVGIRSIPHLETFLGTAVGFGLAAEGDKAIEAVAGWGLRDSAGRAIRYARQMQLPYLALEDGFLRSVGHGRKEPPLSIVVDDLGIYYDASRPSRLEDLVAQELSPSQRRRAGAVISLWREGRVSKFNNFREYSWAHVDGVAENGRYVLVVDQTRGDASIRFGMADQASFQRMLRAALEENPDSTILLKIHPDVVSGRKRGHFNIDELLHNPRIRVLAGEVHPVALVEHAEAIYTVTSQLGFEGVLWGKPVRTFGMPFYAGWGLTNDALPAPARRRQCTLEQLVHAALIDYPRYVHPETGRGTEVEEIISYLALQRRMRERFAPSVHGLCFSLYKRRAISRFFSGSQLHFIRHRSAAPEGATIAVWGKSEAVPGGSSSPGEAVEVVHLEDGFLRSVGLGADLIRPLSWVIDRRGIYYDASRASDLEHLLQSGSFDTRLCTRAARLRARIVAEGLTKYNVGKGPWQPPAMGGSQEPGMGGAVSRSKIILVPGQVETDASIRHGATSIRTNLALLRAVRSANPDAYLVYKSHPDVVSGLRARGEGEEEAHGWCDEVVNDISMHELLGKVDEVHVLTSLTGFEALLRGKPVVTYGQPFYCGWGLTRDLALTPGLSRRRTRKLSLDELVAGALILYPTYVSRTTGHFTTPERVLDELLSWREHSAHSMPLWRWPLRLILALWGRLR